MPHTHPVRAKELPHMKILLPLQGVMYKSRDTRGASPGYMFIAPSGRFAAISLHTS